MEKFRVKVRDTKTYIVQIEAPNKEVAMLKAKAGAGIGIDFVRTETYAEILSSSDGEPTKERPLIENSL